MASRNEGGRGRKRASSTRKGRSTPARTRKARGQENPGRPGAERRESMAQRDARTMKQ